MKTVAPGAFAVWMPPPKASVLTRSWIRTSTKPTSASAGSSSSRTSNPYFPQQTSAPSTRTGVSSRVREVKSPLRTGASAKCARIHAAAPKRPASTGASTGASTATSLETSALVLSVEASIASSVPASAGVAESPASRPASEGMSSSPQAKEEKASKRANRMGIRRRFLVGGECISAMRHPPGQLGPAWDLTQ